MLNVGVTKSPRGSGAPLLATTELRSGGTHKDIWKDKGWGWQSRVPASPLEEKGRGQGPDNHEHFSYPGKQVNEKLTTHPWPN